MRAESTDWARSRGIGLMRCPRCRCTQLKLGIVFAGEVACTFRNGEVVEVLDAGALDSYWSDDSACQCINCGWTGRVRDLKPGAERRSRPQTAATTGRSPDRLADVERQAADGSCPKAIRQDVQRLLEMIRHLQKEVQILEMVTRAREAGRLASGSDTVIF